VATTPPWIVQSSPVGASKGLPEPSGSPAWVVKSGAVNPPANTAQPAAFDPTKEGKLQGIWDYTKNTQADTGIANVPTEQYKPYVNYLENNQSGEDGMNRTQTWNEMNWDALPNKGVTKYGKIGEDAILVKNINGLNDKNQVYFDDNYGWVTHKSNVSQDHNWLHTIGSNGALMASLAMGGLMGVALPAGMIAAGVKGAMGAAPGMMNGDWKSAAAGLVGSGLGSYGVSQGMPTWAVPLVKAGVSTAANGFNQNSLVNAGISAAGGALGLPDWIVKTATPLASMYIQGRG
jgi:hypothetical protein